MFFVKNIWNALSHFYRRFRLFLYLNLLETYQKSQPMRKPSIFPLPSVAIPNIMINRPSVTEYSFESERRAIADYEKNKNALAVKVMELKTKSVTPERQSNIIVEKIPNVVCELHSRKVHSDVILEPSRVVATTSQQLLESYFSSIPKISVNDCEIHVETESFDLLELSTIDDKAALEQILANAPSQLSPNVIGNTVQSSAELLSSSSVPNTGLNVSETGDTHNVYNLSTALKNYNSSFGIGVPKDNDWHELLMKMLSFEVLFIDICLFLIPFLGTSALQTIFPENIFTNGRLAYKRLLVDPQSASLYVGANGHLFRLWAYNINTTASIDGLVFYICSCRTSGFLADAEECLRSGHAECNNEVRLMFLKEGHQTLLICSSNAMKPQLRELDALSLQERSLPENVIGVCSAHEDLNTTAVLVEWGNPDDIPAIYSGIRTGLILDSNLIYRPPLLKNNKEVYSSMRTIYTDSKWLYEPDFVASFNIDKYVYFFFREVAIERENCERTVYSRVARICKKDIGGKNVMRQVWTTFVKARLNCSSFSEFPVYFNEIQSLRSVDGRSDSFFYATFTTPEIVFGLFDHGYFWNETHPMCTTNSASVPDSSLQFARSHLLMADAASAGRPLLIVRHELLTHIAVDPMEDVNVIFVYSHSSQKLYKVAHWFEEANRHSKLLATYILKNTGTVFTITLLPGEFLYLSGEDKVAQYVLSQCLLYTTCAQCATDPYCSWNIARGLCYKRERAHLSAAGWINSNYKDVDKCLEHIRRITTNAYIGDTLHLTCVAQSTWIFNTGPVSPSEKRQLTTEGGLVVFNVSGVDSGTYECSVDEEVIMMYEVTIDDAECAQPTSIAQFKSKYREWCQKFARYKHSAEKWQLWYDRNAANCPRQRITDFNHINDINVE
ncbi:Semaphorin-2A [Dirofilaria immitis]|nr:Semaphorin-2A [Dirofilaria immitis]